MPLHPLFSDRLHVFADKSLSWDEQLAAFNAPFSEYVSPPVQTEDLSITTATHEIPIRTYIPANCTETMPGLVWFHGGGFTEGGLWQNESDVVARELCHRGQLVVIAVDYRLCNDELRFPAPLLDGVEALNWFVRESEKFPVDQKRIFIGGISAGGALAASVALYDRDSGANSIAGTLLNCPILHFRLPEPSAELLAKLDEVQGFGLTSEYVATRNDFLAGDAGANFPKWWFAGEVGDLAGLPPTQIINCEYDVLRASGEKFADQLMAAGTEVELSFEPQTPHAHINRYPQDCPPMDNTLNSMIDFIHRH